MYMYIALRNLISNYLKNEDLMFTFGYFTSKSILSFIVMLQWKNIEKLILSLLLQKQNMNANKTDCFNIWTVSSDWDGSKVTRHFILC